MSERRPHWDDMLLNDIPIPEGVRLTDAELYAIIAAVEGWHKAKRDSRDRTHSDECWRWHQECAEHLIEAQQAAIRRVRAYLDARDEGLSDEARAEGHFVLVDTDSVRRALNGSDD